MDSEWFLLCQSSTEALDHGDGDGGGGVGVVWEGSSRLVSRTASYKYKDLLDKPAGNGFGGSVSKMLSVGWGSVREAAAGRSVGQ